MTTGDAQHRVQESLSELDSAMEALLEKHGPDKARVAMFAYQAKALHNMLKRRGVDEATLQRVADYHANLLLEIVVGHEFDAREIQKIAEGIIQHAALATADVIEATNKPQEKQQNG